MQHRPHFTLRRLEVFAAIADCGGFRAAADKLGMTQPSVSTHVEALERDLKGALFHRRRGRGNELTHLGTTFLKHARQVLADADSMAAEVAHTRDEQRRRVVFACQRSLGDVLSSTLADFARVHRNIELVTRVGRQEEVIEWVGAGMTDIGLCLGADGTAGLDATIVGQQQFVVIASPRHPLSNRSAVEPAELVHHDFVAAPHQSLLGKGIGRLLATVGAAPLRIISRATEFEFLRALVLADVGLYCCLASHVQTDIATGRLVALRLNAPPLTLPVVQIVSPGRTLSRAVDEFATFQRRRLTAISSGRSG